MVEERANLDYGREAPGEDVHPVEGDGFVMTDADEAAAPRDEEPGEDDAENAPSSYGAP